MTLIIDTGGILSVLDENQEDHEDFAEALSVIPGPHIISPLVIAELDYLVQTRYGRSAELAMLEEVEEAYQIASFGNSDMARARALLRRYEALESFGLADASCVVLAERHDCFDILTTDERDFRTVMGSRGRYFRLVPYDL